MRFFASRRSMRRQSRTFARATRFDREIERRSVHDPLGFDLHQARRFDAHCRQAIACTRAGVANDRTVAIIRDNEAIAGCHGMANLEQDSRIADTYRTRRKISIVRAHHPLSWLEQRKRRQRRRLGRGCEQPE